MGQSEANNSVAPVLEKLFRYKPNALFSLECVEIYLKKSKARSEAIFSAKYDPRPKNTYFVLAQVGLKNTILQKKSLQTSQYTLSSLDCVEIYKKKHLSVSQPIRQHVS